jgi:hypothetical protein
LPVLSCSVVCAIPRQTLQSSVSNCLDESTVYLARLNEAIRVWTRVEDVEPLMTRLELLVERLNATILAAACIAGLAIVMQFYHPQWQAWIGVVFWIAVAAAITDSVRTLWALRK